MSTISTTYSPSRGRREWEPLVDREELHDLPLTPREGWTTFFALTVMMITVAVAVDDATWAGFAFGSPGASQTGFLPLAALFSVLIGTYLAKSELSVRRIHLLGSLAGAALLLYWISAEISVAPSIEGRLRDLNLSVVTFVNESVVAGVRSGETSIFLLLIGALVWAAGQFAAVAVFRRHRPMPAIVLVGLILLVNVLLTVREQYVHLVVFSAAALVLLVRLNLLDQTREWHSRGMRDVADISGSFMRNGALFVALAVVAATTLATNASSAPLSRAWNNVDDELLEVGYAINRWLGGVSGPARGPNVLFLPSQTIRGFWQSSTNEVFSASISDGVGRRWRGATYDSFDGRTWQQLDRQVRVLAAGESILAATTEVVRIGPGTKEVSYTVVPADFGGDVFVAPADPLTVDQPTEVLTNGADGSFVAAKLSYGIEPNTPYTVRSLVRKLTGSGALTASQLAAAGIDYPSWISRYRAIRPDSIGDSVVSTAREIRDRLPVGQRDPYHIAVAVQDYLYRTGGFQYNTDVRGLCGAEKLVDCFLRVKQGYCEYFATAMVMLLRALDIPARYVLGYLPGQRQSDGTWRVDRSAAHAWVEVFFPGIGWVEFDPTPGNAENGQQPTRLLPGGPAASPDDGMVFPPGREDDCINLECEEPGGGPLPPETPAGPAPPGPLPLILVLGLIALATILAAWAAVRRLPSTGPELAYSGITRLATRLGHGPRPAQTAYEFAAALGELVPVARSDLKLIATAKVEATYGRREPGESMLRSLAAAYRRARFGLFRLLLRRPRFGRGPRSVR